MDLTSLIGPGLGGGLFGLAGTLASKALGLYESKQTFAQNKEEWSHQERLAEAQAQAKTAESDQALRLAAAAGSWNGLAESLKAETAIGPSYPWVNAVRALVRPALTLGLGGFLCAAFFALPASDAARAAISDSLVFAAVTALTWWFGDRTPPKSR